MLRGNAPRFGNLCGLVKLEEFGSDSLIMCKWISNVHDGFYHGLNRIISTDVRSVLCVMIFS